jgi:two-component system OmpR family sensor kinase
MSRDRALSRIEREAERMGALVGDLAVLAREGEGPAPARYRVDLAAVAVDAVTDARALDPSRPIELRVEDGVTVAGEGPRLEQLVHNLVGNALAHTPPGTPVDVRVAVEGDEAVLEVADQGPGMTAEQAAHVFDRFYRGEAGRLDGGSGLGLFIVARLAQSIGGRVSVDTEVGTGSTFQVVLPLYQDDGKEARGDSEDEAESSDSDEDKPVDGGTGRLDRTSRSGAEREREDAGVD